MTQIMKAHHQWSKRPDEERFTSLTAMHDHFLDLRVRSQGKVVSSRKIEAVPVKDDPRALLLVGPNGGPVNVTHYAFGQLAARAGAPAGYLRGLPGALAADCVNYGLHIERQVEDIGVLLTRPNGPRDIFEDDGDRRAEVRAVTGPNYGRVWNCELTERLVERFGDGISGDFRVPGEFGSAVEVTKSNTTLYASDRDCFVFLADERNRVEVPNRRDGESGSLAKGIFAWNSEVGDQTIGIGMFLFDYVCCNRIVWGVAEQVEKRFRHTSAAPDRFVEELLPAIDAFCRSNIGPAEALVLAAQRRKVGALDKFLKARYFTAGQATGIKSAFLADEVRPLADGASIWDMVTAVTAYARGMRWQSERVKMEREAGAILNLAA